ncbi:MAG: hypothetical protein AAF485_07180 [Chloroflexota bacterium]
MACRKNVSAVSRTASLKAGLSSLGSQATALIGQTVATVRATDETINRGAGGMAAKAVKTVDMFELPQTIDSLTPVAAVAALVTNNNKTRLKILNAITALQLTRTVSAGVGTGVARLTRPQNGAIRTESFFDHRMPPVHLWQSKVTPALNARDMIRWPGTIVELSRGQMLETQGKSWHLGTVVATVGQTRKTMTHLQSLSLPATHYYFNKTLSEREAAGIILGKSEYNPKYMAGFAGQVTELESLIPNLGHLKHALIQSGILWGDTTPVLGPKAGGKAKVKQAQYQQRQLTGQDYSPQRYDLSLAGSLSAQFFGRNCQEADLKRVIGTPPGTHQNGVMKQVGSTTYILSGKLGDVHYSKTNEQAATLKIEAVIPRRDEGRRLQGALEGIGRKS